jgi:sodium-dependent phosphate cotransporter
VQQLSESFSSESTMRDSQKPLPDFFSEGEQELKHKEVIAEIRTSLQTRKMEELKHKEEGEGRSGTEEEEEKSDVTEEKLTPTRLAICILGALLSFWVFLIGLSLMGNSFKVIAGRGASGFLTAVDNPISGLMAGILGTVLLQSSSTSTSIVVSMVGEEVVSLENAIPIIMGANIGTSVTNTFVSLGSVGNRIELERAFAGATVHDMFNMLTVATLLPIEVITEAISKQDGLLISGKGGILQWLSQGLTDALLGGDGGGDLFESPTKVITSPVVGAILKANKRVLNALSLVKPTERETNLTSCPWDNSSHLNCSVYTCFDKAMSDNLKKISESGYENLTDCSSMLDGIAECGTGTCYLDGLQLYEDEVANGRLIKGGFLYGAGDQVGGVLALLIAILLLTGGLVGLTKTLQAIFLSSAKQVLKCAANLNVYVAILIGTAITIVVQSSSVTTSTLTPLCGLGVLPLAKMLPLTLGANIGTCTTALISALVALEDDTLQIALVHLCFNIMGILIWFPIPAMRNFPLRGAEILGMYASFFRWVPLAYIFVAFVIIPLIFLGVAELFKASLAAGFVVLFLLLVAFAVFEYAWWVGIPKGNALSLKVLSEDQREEGRRALEAANAKLQGDNLPTERDDTDLSTIEMRTEASKEV